MNTHLAFTPRSPQFPLVNHPKAISAAADDEHDAEWEKFIAVGLETRIAQAELVARWERRLSVLAY